MTSDDSTKLADPGPAHIAVELRRALGDRLRATYRFGSALAMSVDTDEDSVAGRRVLALVDAVDLDVLTAVAPIAKTADKMGLDLRLDTADDIADGADAYPDLTLELIETKRLIDGDDVLATLTVHTVDLRLRLEQSLRALHQGLVRSFLRAGDDPRRLTAALARGGRRLVYLAQGILILKGCLAGPDAGETPAVGLRRILEVGRPVFGEDGTAVLRDVAAAIAQPQSPALAGDAGVALFGRAVGFVHALAKIADAHED